MNSEHSAKGFYRREERCNHTYHWEAKGYIYSYNYWLLRDRMNQMGPKKDQSVDMFSRCLSGGECDTQGDRDIRAINMLSELKQLPLRNPEQGYLNILRHVGRLCYSWLFSNFKLGAFLVMLCHRQNTTVSVLCTLSCSPGVLSNKFQSVHSWNT